MNKLLLILLLCISYSCKKHEETLTVLPPCLKTLIADKQRSASLKTIRVQKINGKNHFWLNTDARHLDSSEAIVDSSCDTICGTCGECILPECLRKYGSEDDWKIIWRK